MRLSAIFLLLFVCSATMPMAQQSDRSTEKSTEKSGSKKDLAELRKELARLSNELEKLEKNGETEKSPEVRDTKIRETQVRIAEIQKIIGAKKRSKQLSEEEIEARINALRSELKRANEAIISIAKIEPKAEELRMLQRRVKRKKRALAQWLAYQKKVQEEKNNSETKLKPPMEPEEIDLSRSSNKPQLRFFVLDHVPAEYALRVAKPFLTKNNEAISVDFNKNTLIVKDLPYVLAELDRILAYIDTDAENRKNKK